MQVGNIKNFPVWGSDYSWISAIELQISAHTLGISAGQTSYISTHPRDISTQHQISAHVPDISNQTLYISTHPRDISIQTSNISTCAPDISTQTSNISIQPCDISTQTPYISITPRYRHSIASNNLLQPKQNPHTLGACEGPKLNIPPMETIFFKQFICCSWSHGSGFIVREAWLFLCPCF